jgi:hypothetical protein
MCVEEEHVREVLRGKREGTLLFVFNKSILINQNTAVIIYI